MEQPKPKRLLGFKQLYKAISGANKIKEQFQKLYQINENPKIEATAAAKIYVEDLSKSLGKMYAIGHMIHYHPR